MSGVGAPAPWRIAFDNARDPYTARNALGITTSGGGGGSGAPDDAEYITAAPDPDLTSERVLTDTVSVTWDFTVAGVAKANVTPAVTAGYVLKTGDTMSGALVIDTSAGLTVFDTPTHTTGVGYSSGGISAGGLAANIGLSYNTRGSGVHAFSTGAPSAGTTQVQISHQTAAGVLSFQGGAGANNISMSSLGPVSIGNVALTGANSAITQAAADNSTSIATTAWVKLQGYGTGGGDVFLAANNAFTGSNTFASSGRTSFGHTALVNGGIVDVHGDGTTGNLYITGWVGASAGAKGSLILQKSRGATPGTRGALTTGDNVGGIIFAGDDGTVFRTAAQVVVQADGAFFGTGLPGRMLIQTASAAGALTERMRIDSAGVVTVGPNATPYVSMSATENAIKGVTNGSNAAAGIVGEYQEASGSGVAVASGTVGAIASFTLQAGDWDVWAGFFMNGAASGAALWASIATTSSTTTNTPNRSTTNIALPSGYCAMSVGTSRQSITAPLTLYATLYNPSGAGVTAAATICARRVR